MTDDDNEVGMDFVEFALEQIRFGKEGEDYARSVMPDGTEVYELGDGITIQVTPAGTSSIVFARR